MDPISGKVRRSHGGGSRRVFRQYAWLGVGSVKVALSRPTHQPSSGCFATGNARRWAADCVKIQQDADRYFFLLVQ